MSTKRTSRAPKRTSRAPKRASRRIIRRNPDAGLALPPEPMFIERIDRVEDHLSMPGQYYTTTGQQAYLVAKSFTWHPLVQGGEETYFVEGSVFHWTVLPEEKSPTSNVLPEELLNERVEIEYLVELSQPLEIPERNPRGLRRNDEDSTGEDWGVTENYFIDRLDAYERWEPAFWRELLQNSRDAGSTRIELSSESATYTDPKTGESLPAILCVCRDNGSGMDRDTLKRAFFTLGGSVKPAGAVGGFGDAKELILVPWYRYEVRTRDLLAVGQHQRLYAPGIQSGQPFLQGTEIRVWMPVKKSTNESYAIGVLEKSHLSGIRVFVNGERVNSDLIGGEKIREYEISTTTYTVRWTQDGEARSQSFAYSDEFYEFIRGLHKKGIAYEESRSETAVGKMEIWRQPRAKRHGCFVRGSGVFMFEKEIDSHIKGAIFVDIFAPPRGVFTRKRDGLASSSTASAYLTAYINELSVDPLSALKKERASRDKQRIIYTGNGPMNASEGEGARVAEEERAKRKAKAAEVGAEVATAVDLSKVKETKGGDVELTPVQVAKMLEMMKAFLERQQAEADKAADEQPEKPIDQTPPPDLTPVPETFESMAKDGVFANREQLAGALQFAAWKPDLFVYQNLDNWKMPKDFNPLTMKPKYLRLLRLWAELCKYALFRLGLFKPFGVGWVFDTEADERDTANVLVMAAAHTKEAGTDWLLLNPVKMKRTKEGEYAEYEVEGDLYDLSSEKSLRSLCRSVIHEVTHMQGFGKHDQRYAYALSDNIDLAFEMLPAAKRIMKGVNRVVREEVRERKVAREIESQIPWDALVGKAILAVRIVQKHDWRSGISFDEVKRGRQSVTEVVRRMSSRASAISDPTYVREELADGRRVYDDEVNANMLLRLYEALRDKGLLPAVSNEDAASYTHRVFKTGFDLPDVRERKEVEPPAEIGVYNVTKRTKDGASQWVLREGYSGLRGKEIASGELRSWDRLDSGSRYDAALKAARPDGMWIVWMQKDSSGGSKGFSSGMGLELTAALGLDHHRADMDVYQVSDKTNWRLETYAMGKTATSKYGGAPGVGPILSAAEAQAAGVDQLAAALRAKRAEPAKPPEPADRIVVPGAMGADQFAALFPLFVCSRMIVSAETLRDRESLMRAAREMGETVMIEGPEWLFSNSTDLPVPVSVKSALPGAGEPHFLLEGLGRDAIRAYFDGGGMEIDTEAEFSMYVEVVRRMWDLTDTKFCITESEEEKTGARTVRATES